MMKSTDNTSGWPVCGERNDMMILFSPFRELPGMMEGQTLMRENTVLLSVLWIEIIQCLWPRITFIPLTRKM